MNILNTIDKPVPTGRAPRIGVRLLSTFAAAFIGLGTFATGADAQDPAGDDENTEVLTRGPVHEAFASVVDYNPSRGFVAPKAPPDAIDELPPEERPDGEDVTWIPGYWAWDDDSSDFIWVSGIWRVMPPGREWIPGYWSEDDGQYLWISGYWGDIESQETTYLPPPPRSLESGPNIEQPSIDYSWMPGCWVWYRSSYAWRPGYWARGRGDWVWIPSHYVWTPRGYIFIEGYWDYTVARRGIVYAPVRFRSRAYERHGYVYSPWVAFNLGLFVDYLFLRPSCNHYYFGDYYASRYEDEGFFVSFSYYYGWHGYDPFYSHLRWEHRSDRDWEGRFRASYRYRRENETARPPDTWSAQVAISRSTTTSTQNRIVIAGTTTQLASTKNFSVKFRKVDNDERQRLGSRSREFHESRDQRRTLEARAPTATRVASGATAGPARLERLKSPIVAKSIRQIPSKDAPPKVYKEPKPDLKVQPGAEARGTASSQVGKNSSAQPKSPKVEKRKQPADTSANATRETQGKREAAGSVRGDNQAAERAQADKARAQEESKRKTLESQQRKEQEASAKRTQQSEAQSRKDAQARAEKEKTDRAHAEKSRAQEESKRTEQQASEKRTQQSEAQARKDAQARAEKEKTERARAEKARAQEESQRKALESQQAEARARSEAQARQEAQARDRQAAGQRARSDEARATKETSQREQQSKAQKSNGSDNSGKKKPDESDDDSEKKKGNGNGRP